MRPLVVDQRGAFPMGQIWATSGLAGTLLKPTGLCGLEEPGDLSRRRLELFSQNHRSNRQFSMNIKEPVLRNAQWDAEGPEGPTNNPQNGCEQVVCGGEWRRIKLFSYDTPQVLLLQ